LNLPPCAYSKTVEMVVPHLSSTPYVQFLLTIPKILCVSPYLEYAKVASLALLNTGLKSNTSPVISASI